MNDKNTIKVVELFAGVGGFRLGLERASNKFKTVWANQWEPSKKIQHAADIYKYHWNDNTLINEDIEKVWKSTPEHDLLVGGFPCQDYSVAQGNKAKGITGKKGILWWSIYNIIKDKKPKMVFLENVDRLLKSPSNQRGRDFAIMLKCLNDEGYVVEWMKINAADYGYVQKRRRVFIFAFRNELNIKPDKNYLTKLSIFKDSFPIKDLYESKNINLNNKKYRNLINLTNNYSDGKFGDIGVAIEGTSFSASYKPIDFPDEQKKKLKHILEKKGNFKFLTNEQLLKIKYLKNAKSIPRKDKNGFTYSYTEGKMYFPENHSLPGRTMLTSEGTINRSSHFIKHKNNIRFLTPIEAERMNGFPDNWTNIKEDRFRYFAMGNALVVDIISKIGREIEKILKQD